MKNKEEEKVKIYLTKKKTITANLSIVPTFIVDVLLKFILSSKRVLS